MVALVVFGAATASLAWVSRASLLVPGSHGFYRFLVWELLLAMAVTGFDGWPSDPLAPDQAIGGALMGLSGLLAAASYATLRSLGKPDGARGDEPLLPFERTTVLVTRGIYRHIRHPMFASLALLALGLLARRISWTSGALALAAGILIVAGALAEERENVRYFGEAYREYMDRTKRFVPFIV